MAPQKEKTVVSLLNGPLSKLNGLKFKPELLQRMDSLYAFYHKQWWCYRKCSIILSFTTPCSMGWPYY